MVNSKITKKKVGTDNIRYNIRYKFGQLSLSGEKVPETYEKLRGHQYKILETFALNENTGLSQINIINVWEGDYHENTIKNFFRNAVRKGWILQLIPIKGATISTAYIHRIDPDYLATGQKVPKDKRYKYYQITGEGIRVFELNKVYK